MMGFFKCDIKFMTKYVCMCVCIVFVIIMIILGKCEGITGFSLAETVELHRITSAEDMSQSLIMEIC